MNKIKVLRFTTPFLVLFLLSSFSVSANGINFEKERGDHEARAIKLFKAICDFRIKLNERHPRIPVPKICKAPDPDPLPVSLELNIEPQTINQGEEATISWASENALGCEASGDWSGEKTLTGEEVVSPSTDSTYTLTCDGADGGVEKSISVVVVLPPPPPEPSIDHLIISEVYYDVDALHGTESSNEWIEIYNGTGASVDIGGWILADNSAETDAIPLGTIIPNNSFLVLTASSTTSTLWGVSMVDIGNRIGNSLSNTGDVVMLKNGDVVVDSVSYGTDISAFDPSVVDVAEGHSIRRTNLTTDSNSASDWEDLIVPTPGTF